MSRKHPYKIHKNLEEVDLDRKTKGPRWRARWVALGVTRGEFHLHTMRARLDRLERRNLSRSKP